MAFYQQSKPLGTFKILSEALRLPTKNSTLILPILLSSFLSSSLLFISAYLLIRPVTADLTSNAIAIASASTNPNTPEQASIHAAILDDLKQIIGIEAVFIFISFIVSSLIAIATIHAFCLTIYTGKLSTHEDLLRRLRGGGVKRPLITKLYVKLLGLGYLFLFVALGGVIFLIARHGSMTLIVFGVVVALLGLLLYLYLVLVWSVSVVVSVAEDGCYGLDAISKAGEVIRGRRRQGVLLVVIEFLVIGVVYGIHELAKVHVSHCTTAQIAVGLVYVAGCVLVSLFECTVSTVFYLDCKKIDGGEGIAIVDGGFMYGSVPSAASDKV